jgi:predicted dinucleotide-binding enzyme
MKIAIIGAGSVGSALAQGFTRAGHSVTVSSHKSADARRVADAVGASAAASNAEAVTDAEIVVLAVPVSALAGVAEELRDALRGRTVIDVNNLTNSDNTAITATPSGAQALQDLLPGALVVKAFNTVFSSLQASPIVEGVQLDGFYAGDDDEAKEKVRTLLADMGYRPIDAGPLAMARALEELGLLMVRLSEAQGWKWKPAWKLIGAGGPE